MHAQTQIEEITNSIYNLRFATTSESDRYVYSEIYGQEDSYRRERLLPFILDSTVIEIGAHKGYFSLLAGSVANRVFCFEPDFENFNYLSHNIQLNHMGHVTAINKAVSNTEDNRMLTVSNITAARHTLIASEFSGVGCTVEVNCTTLPAIFCNPEYSIDRVRLLKVDCEGGEYDIFLGCDTSVFQKIDAIALELHETPTIPHKMTELVQFLKQLGYTAEIYDERVMGDMHVWMAWFVKPWAYQRLQQR